MTEITGNLLDITDGVIVHQVNCKKKMGAGLALQIRHKWPQHYEDYMCHPQKLGAVVGTKISDTLYIAGVFGQYGYGKGRQTNYTALKHGLSLIARSAKKHNLPVYIPYGLGCGLAGGDWNVVEKIIQETNPNAVVIRKVGKIRKK